MPLKRISRDLARRVDALRFAPPVAVVYNPLRYARLPHERYLERFGQGPKDVLLVGMNPGPWGMVQTGVPFGDVGMVRDWMGIEERVDVPATTHAKRPILGFTCERREVSGTRLWSWAAEHFDTPEAFFTRFFVWNACPLAFLEAGGRNRTPDKLPAEERGPLLEICDASLARAVDALAPRHLIGIGTFAEQRLRAAVGRDDERIGRILHPSPASPLANRGWAAQVTRQFAALGIEA